MLTKYNFRHVGRLVEKACEPGSPQVIVETVFSYVDMDPFVNMTSIRILVAEGGWNILLRLSQPEAYWRPVFATTLNELKRVLPDTWSNSLQYFCNLGLGA